MKELVSNFLTNGWTYTVIGGIIATVVGGYLLKKFFGANGTKAEGVHITNTINNQSPANPKTLGEKETVTGDVTKIVGYKKTARILFIDNESLRDKIRGLKNAGWDNVTQIKDVENIDSPDIRDANVVFVDYKGIGGGEKEQGLAVITALKTRYGEEKWLILFTAYNVPVTAFEKGANDYLAKNSGTYETEQKIIKGLQKLEQ